MAEREWWLLLPRPVRRLPADLAAVVVMVLLTNIAALAPVLRETPLRIVVGLPFVLFLPGYAFVSALFPEAGEAPGNEETDRSGIDGIERVALSVGLSVAIVPLIGLGLNLTPWGIRLVPILFFVSVFTIGAMAVAASRRWELPENDRFVVPYRNWLVAVRAELIEPDSRADALLNVLLVVSILLATVSVGYAVAVPKQGESFTEFYLLNRDADGELVASDYPTEFVVGESRTLVVGIGNQEHGTVSYTVVLELQRTHLENNTTTIVESRELRRFQPELAHNETWTLQHSVTPTITGERLRLIYLLYRGSPPGDPSTETAYREVHLWINVSSG